MTDDLLRLAREAGLKAATEDEILDELFRDPFEGVPAKVWEEFTRAAAMFGDGADDTTGAATDDRGE